MNSVTSITKKRTKRKKMLKKPVLLPTKGNFSINVFFIPTKKILRTDRVYGDMKITELKALMELIVGLPSDMQRLSYLDDADLVDTSDVKGNDIVPCSTLTMNVWDMWKDLVAAVATNDILTVFELGVTQSSDFTTPNLEYMTKASQRRCISRRAELALMLAAHHGHQELCRRLIDAGTSLNATTPNGRTALHFVAAQGHGNIVDMLLANGINVNAEDKFGKTALNVAEQFEHKTCGRHLFLFRWQQRAKQVKPQTDIPLKAFQFFDSTHKVGYKGEALQCYRMQIGVPEEYDSTYLNARPHSPYAKKSFKYRIEQLKNGYGADGAERRPSQAHLPPLPLSHSDWMKSKHEHRKEKQERERKKHHRKLMQQEDKKFSELAKAESYDNWLKKQSQQLTFDTKSPGPSPAPSQDLKTKGYLREYLDSLLEHKRPGVMSNNWLILRGIDMLDSVEERPPLSPILS